MQGRLKFISLSLAAIIMRSLHEVHKMDTTDVHPSACLICETTERNLMKFCISGGGGGGSPVHIFTPVCFRLILILSYHLRISIPGVFSHNVYGHNSPSMRAHCANLGNMSHRSDPFTFSCNINIR
jgi:hypothetical protein